MQHEAVISKSSPRYRDWMNTFGTDTLPVLSPIPVRGNAPGHHLEEFYRVDIAALTPEQLQHAVQHLSQVWRMPVDEVERTLRDPAHGLPILAEGVSVAMDMRLF